MYNSIPGCQIPGLPDIYEKYLGYKTNGRFVEVGAFNCVNWSNTKMLADIGWSGVYIEPNNCMLQECANLYRGNDKIWVIGCACGNETHLDQFGVISRLYLGGSLSTTRVSRISEYKAIGWASFSAPEEKKFSYIVSTTLDNVLNNIDWKPEFDVLVIDTEGTELQVIAGTDLKFWMPKMVIVETHKKSPDNALSEDAGIIDELMHYRGYAIIYEDHINSIYVLKELVNE